MRYLTAGESHGPALVGILEGMPAGLRVGRAAVDAQLARRQGGYGRGMRMKIERDEVEWLSGLRFGVTLGSPIALMIRNRDHANWLDRMAPEGEPSGRPFTRPRPGHADLAGTQKYDRTDARDILERASARETAMRVALGTVAREFLRAFGVEILSHVVALGGVEARAPERLDREEIDASPVRCADADSAQAMMRAIDEAQLHGDTLGGVVEVVATGLPVGLGSHVHWDRKVDGLLAQALMAIPAIKGVEVGMGFWSAGQMGSAVHDEILFEDGRYVRPTNRAGGSEGGITNGEPLVARAAMKPLSSLRRPLRSVDLETKEPFLAQVERSDITAVPAAGVVLEAVMALVLADLFLDKFGGDSMGDVAASLAQYTKRLQP